MTPPDWYGRALWLFAALIIVLLCMAGVAANAQEAPRNWWADRVICLPTSDLPEHQRCGISRIGPFESVEQCHALGPIAWRIEHERLVRGGWGALEFGPVICAYNGDHGVIS